MSATRDGIAYVQSLERALNIMDVLSTKSEGYSIKDLSADTGLNKSTVHRLLQTLRAHGYVYQDRQTEEYHLGYKILELSAHVMESFDIRSIARPLLEELCASTREAVHLSVLDDLDTIYIDKIDNAQRTIRMYSQIGKRIPVYCSATGKALLSLMGPSQLGQLVSRISFERKTNNTITCADDLFAELADVRKHGYAVDWFEHEDSIFCVAAPIFDREKKSIAAISVSAAIWDLSMELFFKMSEQVYLSAKRISKYLGCGDYPLVFLPRPKDQERIAASLR